MLQIQAVVSRQRRTVNAEEAASKAGVKILAPLAILFVAILLVVMGPMVLDIKNRGVFS